MQKEYNFAVEEIKRVEFSDYDETEFAIARLGYISCRPNSHHIGIDEDCLRASAPSALGAWIVADMVAGDASTHTDREHIVGLIPKEQEVEFVRDDDGYLRAYADAIISKRYAADFCEIFEKDNNRAVSIEAKFTIRDDDSAESFDIKGVTVLGATVRPSCPESDIEFIRFSEQDAEEYYRVSQSDSLSKLKTFVEERKTKMAEEKYVTHPINTSKDAVYAGDWDGNKAKQDLIKEKNYKSFAPKVCLKLEDGWEDREVTKLGYPVMGLYDGEWRYSTKAIASAQAFAEQNDETEVLNKIKDIRNKLDLNDEGKEEKMSMEIEFAAVNLNDMWDKIYAALNAKEYGWGYCICGIYEESNQKFVILKDRDCNLYRVDFSYTEEGLTLADEAVKVEQEFVETDEIKKFACPDEFEHLTKFEDEEQPEDGENGEGPGDDDKDDDEQEEKMSADEMLTKIEQLTKDIEERDNIIMEKDAELAELREYKACVMAKENACMVEAIMAEVKPFVNDEQFAAFREEGLACDATTIDAWSNKVKATCFSEVKKSVKKNDNGLFTFAAPIENKKKSASVWDRL